jgi:hypothetical protein
MRGAPIRVFSLLLTPLLIVAGAFAVLRNVGVITGFRLDFHIPSDIHPPARRREITHRGYRSSRPNR